MRSVRLKRLLIILIAVILTFVFTSVTISSAKGNIYNDIPDNIDPSQQYLFYMHGRWIEINGLNRPHLYHGHYEYNNILKSFAEMGFVVISEVRSENVDFKEYASKIARQARNLLNQGVSSENITIIGHSKGGLMTLIVAGMMGELKMNFVVMAGCGKKGSDFRPKYEQSLSRDVAYLSGRILSIYDSQDSVAGTCQEAFDKASTIESKEVVLKTGEGHGVFYHPNPVWVEEVAKWAKLK